MSETHCNSLFWAQHYSSHQKWMRPLCVLGSDPSTTSAWCGFGLTHVCVYMEESAKRNPCLLQNQLRDWDRTLLSRRHAAKASHPAGSAAWAQIQLFFPLTSAWGNPRGANTRFRKMISLGLDWTYMLTYPKLNNYRIIPVAWHTIL